MIKLLSVPKDSPTCLADASFGPRSLINHLRPVKAMDGPSIGMQLMGRSTKMTNYRGHFLVLGVARGEFLLRLSVEKIRVGHKKRARHLPHVKVVIWRMLGPFLWRLIITIFV